MRRRHVVAGVCALMAVAAGAVAASARGGAAPASASDEAPATAEVVRQDLVVMSRFDGTLVRAQQRVVEARTAGTVTQVPSAGATVQPGRPLYAVDGVPVLLLPGAVPAYRALRPGSEGADVRQLEQALRDLGLSGFTVDDEYTQGTADAVARLQERTGAPQTGVLDLGSLVFGPSPAVVVSRSVELGRSVAPGAEVLRLAGNELVVELEVELRDRRLVAVGDDVQVQLGGGRQVPGTVRTIGTVATSTGTDDEPGGGETATTVEVEVTLRGGAADEPDGAPVEVLVESERADDVLTVPVTALLALAEGGYGVEVVDGDRVRVVAVRPGLFADGRVEVDGRLDDGQRVVVAQP